MGYRLEKDVLGAVRVPSDAYYGSETQRAKENFPVSGILVSPDFIKSYAILKKSAAQANLKIGKLDSRRAGAIIKSAQEVVQGKLMDQFVVDVFQAGAGTSVNMNLNEVIANRAIELLGGKKGQYKIIHPNDHVNMSQSTNDTYHMNIHISTYIAIESRLIPSLKQLESALEAKSKEFHSIIKIGRTHLQDAVPMTLGQEFSGYAGSVCAVIDRVREAQRLLLESPLGGTAIGTGENSSGAYMKEIHKALAINTGIRFVPTKRMFKTMSTQLEELGIASALKETAITLNKISNDLRLLGSGPVAGFGDITLPAVQPGSSIMPGKINPSMMEMLNMVCMQVMANSNAIEQGANSGQLELNIWMPLISHDLLFSIDILSRATALFTQKAVRGIKANSQSLERNLKLDMSIATALSPYIGYARAAQVARRAYKERKSVKEVAMELKILDGKTLDRILDPRNFCMKKGKK